MDGIEEGLLGLNGICSWARDKPGSASAIEESSFAKKAILEVVSTSVRRRRRITNAILGDG